MNQVLEFLKEVKAAHPSIGTIFTEGSCFRLFKILQVVYPNAKPYYSENDGHWITEIDGHFYDINGRVNQNYVVDHRYRHVTDKTRLASAYVPTHGGQSASYSKYTDTI